MLLRVALLKLVAMTAFATLAAVAQEKKPSVPPGRDPGGMAIALICSGVDYTLPTLAQRLARDGEGELIGWDLEDLDRKPFDRSRGMARPEWGGDGTLLASLLLGAAGVRLVLVRADPGNPLSLARAIAFVAQTPARVAVLPIGSAEGADWTPFRQAAQHFKDVLIIVPAGTAAAPAYPAALGLVNVLAVEPGTASADAVGFGGAARQVSGAPLATAAAGKAAADVLTREPGLDVAALKRRLAQGGGGQYWQAQK